MNRKSKLSETKKNSKVKGLGRGLSALLGSTNKEYADIEMNNISGYRELPINFLVPNPYQPRHYFDEQKSLDLINSIKERGILQPLLVRRRGILDEYEIIAGERRWRAAQVAGLGTIPVLIKIMANGEALEIALIENIQRHDLSAIEEALGFKRLMDEFHHTQEQLGHIVGKSRSHIANILRLLVLPSSVQKLVLEGKLSMGHARALVTVQNPEIMAQRILDEGLSVRQVEVLSKKNKALLENPVQKLKRGKSIKIDKDADTLSLEYDLSQALGMSVLIELKDDGTGELRLKYQSLDQLDEICQKLSS